MEILGINGQAARASLSPANGNDACLAFYLTYICILVRHASLGVRVCKKAGIEMVALIFFFFFSSQLSPRTKSRSATLPPPPHTPSKYDITFLQAALKPFPLTSHAKHLALRLDIRFLVESRSPILPFNFDRSRIPFSPPRESKFSFTSAFRFILSFSFRRTKPVRCKKNWCWTEMEIRAYRPALLPLAPRGCPYKRSNFCLPLELVSDW